MILIRLDSVCRLRARGRGGSRRRRAKDSGTCAHLGFTRWPQDPCPGAAGGQSGSPAHPFPTRSPAPGSGPGRGGAAALPGGRASSARVRGPRAGAGQGRRAAPAARAQDRSRPLAPPAGSHTHVIITGIIPTFLSSLGASRPSLNSLKPRQRVSSVAKGEETEIKRPPQDPLLGSPDLIPGMQFPHPRDHLCALLDHTGPLRGTPRGSRVSSEPRSPEAAW